MAHTPLFTNTNGQPIDVDSVELESQVGGPGSMVISKTFDNSNPAITYLPLPSAWQIPPYLMALRIPHKHLVLLLPFRSLGMLSRFTGQFHLIVPIFISRLMANHQFCQVVQVAKYLLSILSYSCIIKTTLYQDNIPLFFPVIRQRQQGLPLISTPLRSLLLLGFLLVCQALRPVA